MNRVNFAGVIAALCWLAAPAAQAADSDKYLFLEGFLVEHDERIPEAETGTGARIGFGNIFSRTERSRSAIELSFLRNQIQSDARSGDSQRALLVSFVHTYEFGVLDPYLFAGIGGVAEEIGPVDGSFPALEAGIGAWYDLQESTKLRASLSAMSVRNDELSDADAYVDLRFNVGVAFGLSGKAAAPVVARVVDSDGDGLADSQDKCPTTPASTADGCPAAAPVVQTDSDGDGVSDSADQCAGTLSGLKVDASGCAVQTEAQSVVLKGVTFLPGSATLTEDAKKVLDNAAASLSGDKSLKVELGGHTDAQGADAANLKLSQRRADSARAYLVSKGVEGERLTAKGYGESQPIADNNTVEGRAENRRVELKVVK